MAISELIGETLTKIEISKDGDEIIFSSESGLKWRMYHSQDCCESVGIEDICGDLDNLIGSPILVAREDSNQAIDPNSKRSQYDSFTWTFYNMSTVKGDVTIRWFGSSNGYYSESVDFVRIIN